MRPRPSIAWVAGHLPRYLARRIRELGAAPRPAGQGADAAFILQLDGPWGSGKSSILNFLKADLEASKPAWRVVEFNAWRNQHRKPAWWPLIAEIGAALAQRRRWYEFPRAWRVWTAWLWRINWLPIGLAGLLIAALILFAFTTAASRNFSDWGKMLTDVGSGLLALVAMAGIVFAASRRLVFGSAQCG